MIKAASANPEDNKSTSKQALFVWLIPPKGDCTSAGLITLFKCTVPKTRLKAPNGSL